MTEWPNASTEPLDIIEGNECQQQPTLTVERFRRCFNEIARLLKTVTASENTIVRLARERDDAREQRRKWQEASVADRAESERLRAAEPTNAMLAAGLERALQFMAEHNVTELSPFRDYPSPLETLKVVYRAMREAAVHEQRPAKLENGT